MSIAAEQARLLSRAAAALAITPESAAKQLAAARDNLARDALARYAGAQTGRQTCAAFPKQLRAESRKWNTPDDIIDQSISYLRGAGLDVPPQ
jgi:hypothetical protein